MTTSDKLERAHSLLAFWPFMLLERLPWRWLRFVMFLPLAMVSVFMFLLAFPIFLVQVMWEASEEVRK